MNQDSVAPHEHDYEHQGVAAWPEADNLPGSGARAMHYADVYFCRRCCAVRLERERVIGNTYSAIQQGATLYGRRPK